MSTMYVNKLVARDSAGITTPGRPAFKAFTSIYQGTPGAEVYNSSDQLKTIVWNNDSEFGCFNIGNHYNKATGIFTCPESGLYHFETFGWTNSNLSGLGQILIVRNTYDSSGNTVIAEGRVSPSSTGQSQYTRIPAICFSYLNQGDIVQVKIGNENSNLHISQNARYSYFAGYLIG